MDKNLDIMKSPQSKHILPVPWPFAMMRFYCCAMQKALQSSTGKCVKVNAKLSINNGIYVFLLVPYKYMEKKCIQI